MTKMDLRTTSEGYLLYDASGKLWVNETPIVCCLTCRQAYFFETHAPGYYTVVWREDLQAFICTICHASLKKRGTAIVFYHGKSVTESPYDLKTADNAKIWLKKAKVRPRRAHVFENFVPSMRGAAYVVWVGGSYNVVRGQPTSDGYRTPLFLDRLHSRTPAYPPPSFPFHHLPFHRLPFHPSEKARGGVE